MNFFAVTFVLSVLIGCSVAARGTFAQDPSPAAVEQLIERVRSSAQDQATIARGLGIGNMLLSARRYAEAVQLFKALAEKQPENPIVIYAYALATFNTGKPVDAEPLAQRAMALANVITGSDRSERMADAL
ncbi:MAG TPA: tetratricopeptide repeat protein, partial [Pyrinomonadaceae bacterium]